MKTRIITTFLTAIFFVAVLSPAFAQSSEQCFQEGIMKEEGEGNLPAAIDIFNAIVEDSKAGEALQAKALLHVGLCYEKLGKQEATKAYQNLVNNFPGQKNEVSIAKERLSRLLLAEEKTPVSSVQNNLVPKFTKIKIPTKLSWAVKLSPDGKKLAHVSDKKLWITPLSSNLGSNIPGTPVQLNTGGIEVEWTGLDWSRDGKWIAFNDYPKHDENGKYIENQSILIVPSDGGEPKKLVENFRSARVINYRISLSPDAEKIAFSSINENQQQHIFSLDIDTRTSKQLAEMEAREPAFSPDGKSIAFVKDKNMGMDEGDLGLWLVDAEGGTPVKLANAGKASSPVWSPDGKMIAYLDNSKGTQINIAPVNVNGNPNDQKISIDAPEGIEEVRLLAGWTPDNRIGALLVSKLEYGLFTLPAKGGQAAMILNDIRAFQPRWSRDSKQIFYVTQPLEGTGRSYRQFLAFVPASGGKGTPLKTNINGESVKQFAYQSGNRVSPDGKWIVTSTWTPADTNTLKVHWPTSKIWKVSVDGDEAIQITNTPGNFSDMSPCWSPDGKNIAFIRFQLVAGENDIFGGNNRIYTINSEGGEPEILVSITGKYVNSVNWSPDGKTIAFLTKEINEPHTKELNLYDVDTKGLRKIVNIEAANVNNEMAWSPDSKRIAINDALGKVIEVITIADESVEDISTGLVDVNIYHLDWSPDGKRFAFCGWKGGEPEFWFLEDFLLTKQMAEQYLKKGNELFGQWEYEQAIKEYKKAIESDPKSLVALNAQYCTGQTLFRQGKYDRALETFKQLVEENPQSNIAPVTELMISQVEYEIKNGKQTENENSIGERNKIISEHDITYRRVKSFAGKNDIISHTGGLNLSPDARFVVLENKVVPLDGSPPFNLVNKKYVYRSVYSPQMTKAAFFADSAIWVIPVSPISGKATGKPVKLLDGNYDFQNVVGWSPDGGKIAFVRNDNKISDDIWTLSVLDRTLNPITNESGYEKSPVWSPDGKTILYDGDGYCLAPVNGGEHRKLSDGGGNPFWSPDGKWLIFTQNQSEQRLYSLDSGKETTFTFPRQVGRFLGFDREQNKMLFFRSSFNDQWGLKVVSVNGGPSFKPALNNPVYDEKWTGDSRHMIIMSDDENEKSQMKIVSLTGDYSQSIKIDGNFEGRPVLFDCSPDYSHIAFSIEKQNGNKNLYVVPFSVKEAKTTGPAQLIFEDWTGGAYNVNFNWSKDGAKIALIHKKDIWIVPLKGKPRQVTFTPENKRWINWSPDGKWISYVVPSSRTAIVHVISEDGKIDKIVDDKAKASCWCPDSKSIVLLSGNALNVVSNDGTLLKNITDINEQELTVISDLQYSPDEKYLGFIGYNKDEDAIVYLYDFEENKFSELAFDVVNDYKYALRWSPDGKWLSYLTYEQEKVRPEGVLWEADFEEVKAKIVANSQHSAN